MLQCSQKWRCYIIRKLIGKKFGRLFVINEIKEQNVSFCICQCCCGKKVKVRKNNLIYGGVKSCGCFQIEFRIMNGRKMGLRNRKEMYCKICGKNIMRKDYAKTVMKEIEEVGIGYIVNEKGCY